jgi:Pseudouridine synthase II TruB, C-terminal
MIILSEAQALRWRQGQRLNWPDLLEANPQLNFEQLSQTPAQVERSDGEYLGIGQAIDTAGSEAGIETSELALTPKLVWD